MYTSSWCALALALLPALVSAIPLPAQTTPKARKGGVVLPFNRHSRRVAARATDDSDVLGGTVGLGDSADLFYTVAVTVGDSTTAVNLDTGSSDLWVMSSTCRTKQCRQSTATPYDVSKTFKASGGNVDLRYGDSVTGTHADGPVGRDTVTLAGLTLEGQSLAAINDTDNSAISNGGAGILGLGFPAQSFVQAAVISAEIPNTVGTDTFVEQTAKSGPLVPRLILADEIDDPLFAITLQRDTIDVSGEGQITIGQLPDGVDNSSITWVPVRLYDSADGGLDAPSFAPNEVYPLRWEVEIDAVYLDGKKLADSTQQPNGISKPSVSALIDTGNSLIRGPSDVVNNILSTVSPAYAADSSASPLLPCDEGHNLTFQIGGKLFPVDPRDFVAQNKQGDAANCVASNVVSTDAPSVGALFSWNLGDPFLKSNMVVFYYGNLTHPSLDPPRMGFVSLVPQNAEALLDTAVEDAQSAAGAFESTAEAAPTASSLILEGAASASATSESTSSAPAATRTSTPSSPSSSAAPAATVTATATASTNPKSAPVASVSASPSSSPNAAAPRLVGGWWLALPTLSLLASLCIL
ncbi:acid protease [Trametes versicolor FP-101664 SS1]|uniref:acid protease n=1 Tax=Trametes versicolor (strain FP-101664) TaxID=717944 RepID=UPI00046220D4|nr:acid protease [Trametes versicolor FP-101664 SS1]EIW59326.1 acid protease [Trametes versicolor FP-101664 SS1]